MGIYDRDYMRDDTLSSPGVSVGTIIARVGVVVISLFLAVYCLRLPVPLYIKVPALIGVAFLIRFLWGIPRKAEGERFLRQGVLAERRQAYDLAIRHYQLAAERIPKNVYVSLRLLSAYHFSNRTSKAEELILSLDGILLPERYIEEMEFLVSEYRTATFEKVGSKSRMTLA
ncbi:MAG: hypothetical protein AAF591_21520 [Verrucomicrobiota bacterium]